METIEIQVLEFENAELALQHTEAAGTGWALCFNDRYLVAEEPAIERLATGGVPFYRLVDHEMPDGSFRIMSIPVND